YVQCLRGAHSAFEARGINLKRHPGQRRIGTALRRLLAGNRLTRSHYELLVSLRKQLSESDAIQPTNTRLQDAYTLRCIPQILGPSLEGIAFASRIIEREINSCNDNPLVLGNLDYPFHGGNFHGQYVAFASDVLNTAAAEIGVLAERQLDRLLHPH